MKHFAKRLVKPMISLVVIAGLGLAAKRYIDLRLENYGRALYLVASKVQEHDDKLFPKQEVVRAKPTVPAGK